MHEIAPFLYIRHAIEIGKPSNLHVIARSRSKNGDVAIRFPLKSRCYR